MRSAARAWTYRELDAEAERLAAALQASGVRPGSVVALALARDAAHLAVAVLAVLKAGATALPLDPEHPGARLAFQLGDASAHLLLSERAVRDRLPPTASCPILCVEDLLAASTAAARAAAPPPEIAYLVYTSGSTGQPKGVAMRQEALANLVRWQCAESGAERAARTLQFTPATFDVFFQELFATWCSGGELVLVDDATRLDPQRLLALLEQRQITRLFLPFVALQQLAECADRHQLVPGSLRELITAGEQLLATPALRNWLRRMPSCRLVNQYGPSETHVVTQHLLEADPSRWPDLPPIGAAIPGAELFLLGEDGRELTPGEAGELHVGGVCLAAGYHGRPALTAERFLEDVAVRGARRRLYRTGDLARCDAHGNYEFLGRADQQIKLRGHRIEPGEIEVQLAAHPEVAQAVVALKPGPCGSRLVAYLVPRTGRTPGPGSLRQHLERVLPAHMVPASFLTLDAFPLTHSGKVDRRALPEPSRARPALGMAPAAPRGAEECAAVAIWSELLALDQVGVLDNFFALGGDSLTAVRMAARLQDAWGRPVPVTAIFRRPSIRGLLDLLGREGEAPATETETAPLGAAAASADLAVIGMSLRVPGAANVEEFWQLLLAGRDAIRRFSVEELRAAGVPEELLADPDYVRARGCLEDPLGFDAEFFGIAPREAALMDPQQRLFLESCWTALEAAGYAPDAVPGAVGVWGGVSSGMGNDTYLLRVLHARSEGVAPGDRLAAMLGNQNDYLATRVSHKLNLRGPSVSVQSACSTSLLAIAAARQSLLAGHCDLALAGGVCVLFPQRAGYLRQAGDIGSSDGSCRPFDARADGTVFGDGVGVVVLKRLAEAIADGDRIHAVLKGAAVNNDGAEKMSFSAPSAEGQATVIRQALQAAGVPPASVGFVEAHGTATPIGDPIEVEGLCRAFGPQAPGSCALGSVKSNVGHLIAASGVTGFIKTVLALEHARIPPTAHFERPRPELDLDRTPFFVNRVACAWPEKDGPRRAGVSSFGLGGTNVHVVLEQPPLMSQPARLDPPAVVLPLSARDAGELHECCERLALHLETHPELSLAEVATTLQQGRSAQACRRAVVAASSAEAIARLRGAPGAADPQLAAQLAPSGSASAAPSAVFLFPGGGAQYPGMGRELYALEPLARETLDRGLALLPRALSAELRALWLDGATEAGAAAAAWQRPSLQLPALFLLEVALARLLISWGVEPRALLGHSLGEYAAAHLAGTMSFEDALGLVALRGRLFESLPPGGMLSVALSEPAMRARLGEELDLAVVNGQESCIASGPRSELEQLAAALAREGVDASFVRIEVAAHSRRVDPILAEFRAYLQAITLHPPRIPIASNRSGQWLTEAEACSPEYWVGHLRETVRFSAGLRLAAELPDACLIEVGPGRALSSLARAHCGAAPGASGAAVLASMRHAQQAGSDYQVLLGALGAAWCVGLAPRWDAALPRAGRRRAELPGTAFRRRPHGAEAAAAAPAAATGPAAAAAATPPPRAARAGTRQERIQRRLAGILGELSGLDPAGLDPSQPFLEMGFDSLFMTQASLGFKREFKVKISFRQLFDEAPTLDALARYVDERLDPECVVAGTEPTELLAPSPAIGAEPARASAGGAPGELAQQLREIAEALAKLGHSALPAAAPAALGLPAPRAGATPVADRELKFNPYKAIDRGRNGGLTPQQQEHLAALIAQVLARTPRSKEITARHRTHFADPRAVAGFKSLWKEIVYPIAVDHSRGAYLWDADGNRYVDCVGGFGALLFGHAPDFLIEATVEQARSNLDYGPSSALAGELAQRICAMTGMERATFCNTGTEAVLGAMRLARAVTGRETIVTFSGDYHGLHDEVLVKTQEIDGRIVTLPAAPGIPRSASANLLVLEYGAPESLELIRAHADALAAVLVEPVQSRAPELQPREFVQRLRRLTEELGVPLIFDEIITGFRTHPGGAQAYYGVRADLAAYGKVIGAGMPVGVIAGRAEYMDALDGGDWRYGDDSFPEAGVTYFAGTFMRHPLALAAVKGALEVMEREGPALQERLNARVAAFAAAVNDGFEAALLPLRMRHFASMIYPKYGGDPEFEELYYHHLRLRGVHIWAGRPGFLTTAHSDQDLEFLRREFLAAAEAMVAGGFMKRNEPTAVTVRAVPFTEAQEELWLTTRASDGAARALNEPCAFALRGPLNLPVLRRALGKLVERHDALRSAVARDGSGFLVHSQVETPPLEEIDLSGLAEEARAAARDRIYRDDSRQLFALDQAPLLRARILKLAEDQHELLLTVHHLVCDGWSISILFHDLAQLYSRLAQGRNPQLEPAQQLGEFRDWELAQAQSAEHRETLAFWQEQFRELPPPLNLPLDRPRPPLRSYRGNRQTRRIPAEVGGALKAFAVGRKCTLFSTLLAAYAAFLHRLAGARDLALGISSAGQALLGANSLVAHCVHYLPLRVKVRDEETFADLVERVKQDMLIVNEHQDYTLGTLLKSLRMARDASRPSLISADFNLDPALEGVAFAGLSAHYVSTPRDFARLELMFNLIEDDGALLIECDHATDVISVATAASWMEDYERLLRAVAANPAQKVGELLPSAAPAVGFSAAHQLFAARAHADPGAPALEDGGRSISYAELDAWSTVLAAEIRAAALAPGDRIGLHLPRSSAQVAGMLATWKAGCVAVPIEPSHPLARRRAIAADAGLKLLLHRASEAPEPALSAGIRTLAVPIEPSAAAARPAELPGEVAREAPAYVMYTSGSTGVPKGVAVSHGALSNVLLGFACAFGARRDESWLALTAPTFDISLVEVFVPLTVGARVVLAPGGVSCGGAELLALARSAGVAVIQATPSTWHMLLAAGLRREDNLRAISGGEALRPALAAALAQSCRELWNVYGPTEAAVWASLARLRGDEDPVPIGHALPGYRLMILDEALRPVGAGETGELCIGGAGLAIGYLGRASETARAFLCSPHVDGGSTRLYRTGDRARRLPDGSFLCLGRNDQQFKLRGHRVEAGEIEAALESVAGVAQAVVGLRGDGGPEAELVAWLQPSDSAAPPAAAALRAALAEILPRALLPQHFVIMQQFPLNPSGKVDRADLIHGVREGDSHCAESSAQGLAETEALLLGLCRDLLGQDGIDASDDFFLLGGSSLLANRLLLRLEELTGVQLELEKVFLHPTVRGLAEVVDARIYQQELRNAQSRNAAGRREETRL